MNRDFFVNIVFLVLVNVLIKPFYIFGIDRNVQNLVGGEAYGTYFSLTSLSISLMVLNDMGIQNYNTREIAQNPQQLSRFFPNMIVLRSILGVVYLITLELIGFLIGYTWFELQMLFFTGVIQILTTTINYQKGNIAGLGKYWLNSIVTVLDRFLLIIICGVLLWLPSFRAQFTIHWFIYAQVLTLLLALCIAFFFTFSDIKNIKFGFDPIFLRKILRGSFPFAISLF
ncbi:MAG: hypothetical protein HC817_11080 [Saprospiraceae bacterium]|nr:hypothetical protein [Saprospiraceae bacterium]